MPTAVTPTDGKFLPAQQKRFFSDLALRHWKEMRLLLRGGKLWKKAGWRGVVEHSLIQLAVADALAEILHLRNYEREMLRRAAVVHDWKKRMEKAPEDFTHRDHAIAARLFQEVQPDSALLLATTPAFLERALINGEATWLELLQFYIDDLCMGGKIVPWQERIDELEKRKPELNQDQELTRKLGGRYWDKERELAQAVEQLIACDLQARGQGLVTPGDIPEFVRNNIRAKIEKCPR